MGIPADELAARMSVVEFMEHWHEWRMNPWGEDRADLRSGVIASMLANRWRGKNDPARRAEEFLLYPNREPQDLQEMFKTMARTKKRKGKK